MQKNRSLMTLDLSHSFVPQGFLLQTEKKLAPYLEVLLTASQDRQYQRPESVLALPTDLHLRHEVRSIVDRFRGRRLRNVIIVGIGGSNLASKAVYDALRAPTTSITPPIPRLFFVDTIDEAKLQQLQELIAREIRHQEEFVLCVLSESGKTLETIANSALLIHALTKRWPEKDLPIVVVSREGSPLWRQAKVAQWSVVAVPKTVVGRFSFFSAIGIVPLILAGIDVDELSRGARTMMERCLTPGSKNPALLSAGTLVYHNKLPIHDTFYFRPELEAFGHWYRQLVAESLGKKSGVSLPTISMGSTDLHSVAQLYFTAGRKRFTTFLSAPRVSDLRIPASSLTSLVPGIARKKADTLLKVLLTATATAYAKHRFPYLTVTLKNITPHSIGELMMWKLIEVMFMAKVLGVNAFTQPAVESYKRIARNLLKRS